MPFKASTVANFCGVWTFGPWDFKQLVGAVPLFRSSIKFSNGSTCTSDKLLSVTLRQFLPDKIQDFRPPGLGLRRTDKDVRQSVAPFRQALLEERDIHARLRG